MLGKRERACFLGCWSNALLRIKVMSLHLFIQYFTVVNRGIRRKLNNKRVCPVLIFNVTYTETESETPR